MRKRNLVIDGRRAIVGVLAMTLLLFPVVAFTAGTLRVVLALPFALLFPGYTLLSALFPRQSDLDAFRRMALSVGLSVVVLPILGLILNYTPWGIEPMPVLVGTGLFIFVTSAVGWYRQQGLPETERLRFTVGIRLASWKETGRLPRVLAVVMVVAVLTAAGSLGYALSTPREDDSYTEFYITGPDGSAIEYPREATVGQPVSLTVAVVNHEHEPMGYHVDVMAGSDVIRRLKTGTLDSDEKWESAVDFVLRTPGENQRVEFWLYASDSSEPYFEDPLQMYIDVR